MNLTSNAIIQHGLDNLEAISPDQTDAGDLHHELYNMDYFIIGTYQAKEFLDKYGVFDAIEKIKEYEQEHFGEVTTDFSDPEKVVNMLAYIEGEEALYNCDSYGDMEGLLTKSDLKTIKKELEAQL